MVFEGELDQLTLQEMPDTLDAELLAMYELVVQTLERLSDPNLIRKLHTMIAKAKDVG